MNPYAMPKVVIQYVHFIYLAIWTTGYFLTMKPTDGTNDIVYVPLLLLSLIIAYPTTEITIGIQIIIEEKVYAAIGAIKNDLKL